MGGDSRDLWRHLGVEEDEKVVLSALFRTGDGEIALVAASLIVGPPAIADGWPAWRSSEGFKPAPSEDALAAPATFVVELKGAIAGRAVMEPDEAVDWMASVLSTKHAPSVGPLPEARVDLARASAPIRVCTHSQTQAGDLATWVARPINGFHFPPAEDFVAPDPAPSWNLEGQIHFNPAVDLLGMSWFEEKRGDAPKGLLLGRFERRAWLASQKLESDNDLYKVEIGIEPDRVQLIDLEIEVEEQVDGELVFGEHLRLEDTDLREPEKALHGPQPQQGRLEVGVLLPTLGRHVKRLVRLTHRDGELLDEWRSFNIVESISITPTFDGATQRTQTIGERRGPQDLVSLLGAVERVRSQYTQMRKTGVSNRLFDDMNEARDLLREVLLRAPGELLIVDPFFDDWPLLESLGNQAQRVLIGPDSPAPPSTFRGKARRPKAKVAPFHDRFYLWEGGGLSVGTSAGMKTKRLFRISRIGAAEVQELGDMFSLWWIDPAFVPA
jgi:hypothetical protein